MIRWFKKQTIYIRFLLIACVTITIWNIFAFFGGWAVWHLGKFIGIVNYNDLLPDSKFGRIIILDNSAWCRLDNLLGYQETIGNAR